MIKNSFIKTYLFHQFCNIHRSINFGEKKSIIICFILFLIKIFLPICFGEFILKRLNIDFLLIDKLFVNIIFFILFISDFILKLFIYTERIIDIYPYIHLPFRKKSLSDPLILNEFINPLNSYVFLFILPFIYSFSKGINDCIFYTVFIFLISVFNTFFTLLIKLKIRKKNIFLFIILLFGLTILFSVISQYSIFPFGLSYIIDFILENKIRYLILISFSSFLSIIHIKYQFNKKIYEIYEGERSIVYSFYPNEWLSKYGVIGLFIEQEIKMIIRNKKIKVQLLPALYTILLLIYFLCSIDSFYNNFYISILYIILILGSLGFILGQYIFSLESSFFDGLICRPLSLIYLLQAKYIFYSFIAAIFFIILIVLNLFFMHFGFLLLISTFFYVIGPIFFILFHTTLYNNTYQNINESPVFNWKAHDFPQQIITFSSVIFPYLFICLVYYYTNNQEIACVIMTITGLLAFSISKKWIRRIFNSFLKRKYINMTGFRNMSKYI
jgi:hypothetical protein